MTTCGFFDIIEWPGDTPEPPCENEAKWEGVCNYRFACDKHKCRCCRPIGTREAWRRLLDILRWVTVASVAAAYDSVWAEVMAMSDEEVHAELEAEGVDVVGWAERIRRRVADAKVDAAFIHLRDLLDCIDVLSVLQAAREVGREEERADIVAWLRSHSRTEGAADGIERYRLHLAAARRYRLHLAAARREGHDDGDA